MNRSVKLGFAAATLALAAGVASVTAAQASPSRLAAAIAAAASRPSIASASFVGYYGIGAPSPTITLTGSAFGSAPPAGTSDNTNACGTTAANGQVSGSALYFTDDSRFSAGYSGASGADCIGIIVVSWSDSQVVLKFGDVYASRAPWFLDNGDGYALSINGGIFWRYGQRADLIVRNGQYEGPLNLTHLHRRLLSATFSPSAPPTCWSPPAGRGRRPTACSIGSPRIWTSPPRIPPRWMAWSAVFYYFGLWREDGLDQRIQELLRCQVRERARRLEDPSLAIIDTQSVRAAAGVPKTTTGLDANKKVSGRKRGLAVDVLGLIIGVVVLAASVHDNAASTALLDQAAERCGMRLEKALVDQGFKDEVLIDGALMDIDVEVVRRNPEDQGKGFVPQPKRWIVEQVNGTLMLHRRLAREYDHRPDTSASRVYWASIANMASRLTTPAPTWRDTLGLAALTSASSWRTRSSTTKPRPGPVN